MSLEETKFVIHDPTGTVLTLTDREGRAILADLLEDDDLSPALRALRDQLSEWVDPA